MVAPAAASRFAVSSPSPEEPPVITTTWSTIHVSIMMMWDRNKRMDKTVSILFCLAAGSIFEECKLTHRSRSRLVHISIIQLINYHCSADGSYGDGCRACNHSRTTNKDTLLDAPFDGPFGRTDRPSVDCCAEEAESDGGMDLHVTPADLILVTTGNDGRLMIRLQQSSPSLLHPRSRPHRRRRLPHPPYHHRHRCSVSVAMSWQTKIGGLECMPPKWNTLFFMKIIEWLDGRYANSLNLPSKVVECPRKTPRMHHGNQWKSTKIS